MLILELADYRKLVLEKIKPQIYKQIVHTRYVTETNMKHLIPIHISFIFIKFASSQPLTTLEKVCEILKSAKDETILSKSEITEFCGEEHNDCSCPFHLNNGACYYPKPNGTEFHLSGGQIFTPVTKIRTCAFRHLPFLKKLTIKYHQIPNFEPTVFDNLQELEELDIGYNWYSTFDSKLFRKLVNLKSLYLTGNEPKIEGKTLVELPGTVFNSLTNLESLVMSYQGLTTFSSGTFHNLWKLRTLDLSHNEITSLPVGLFENNINLIAMTFRGNNLKTIVPGTFDRNTELVYIDLILNKIHDINSKVFEKLENIERIGLNGNICKPREPEIECYLTEEKWEPKTLQTCDCVLDSSKLRNYL